MDADLNAKEDEIIDDNLLSQNEKGNAVYEILESEGEMMQNHHLSLIP